MLTRVKSLGIVLLLLIIITLSGCTEEGNKKNKKDDNEVVPLVPGQTYDVDGYALRLNTTVPSTPDKVTTYNLEDFSLTVANARSRAERLLPGVIDSSWETMKRDDRVSFVIKGVSSIMVDADGRLIYSKDSCLYDGGDKGNLNDTSALEIAQQFYISNGGSFDDLVLYTTGHGVTITNDVRFNSSYSFHFKRVLPSGLLEMYHSRLDFEVCYTGEISLYINSLKEVKGEGPPASIHSADEAFMHIDASGICSIKEFQIVNITLAYDIKDKKDGKWALSPVWIFYYCMEDEDCSETHFHLGDYFVVDAVTLQPIP